MTRCDKCGKEVGNLYCAKCRAEIIKKTSEVKFGRLIPLLFYDTKLKRYVLGYTVKGCSCNQWNIHFNIGLCSTTAIFLEGTKQLLHEFDGDNIIQQVCG